MKEHTITILGGRGKWAHRKFCTFRWLKLVIIALSWCFQVLRHTLASTNSTRYRDLMQSLFSQPVSSITDYTYDVDAVKVGCPSFHVSSRVDLVKALKFQRFFFSISFSFSLCFIFPSLSTSREVCQKAELSSETA